MKNVWKGEVEAINDYCTFVVKVGAQGRRPRQVAPRIRVFLDDGPQQTCGFPGERERQSRMKALEQRLLGRLVALVPHEVSPVGLLCVKDKNLTILRKSTLRPTQDSNAGKGAKKRQPRASR